MATLERRIADLESFKQAPSRQYTDAERAVRYAYLLQQGGPKADKARALLEKASTQGNDHAKH